MKPDRNGQRNECQGNKKNSADKNMNRRCAQMDANGKNAVMVDRVALRPCLSAERTLGVWLCRGLAEASAALRCAGGGMVAARPLPPRQGATSVMVDMLALRACLSAQRTLVVWLGRGRAKDSAALRCAGGGMVAARPLPPRRGATAVMVDRVALRACLSAQRTLVVWLGRGRGSFRRPALRWRRHGRSAAISTTAGRDGPRSAAL